MMTRKVVLVALLSISVIAPLCKGQSIKAAATNYDPLSPQKLQLISDLKSLEVRVPKLDGLLARALSKTEIADAAWTLDQVWAEKLLREAYEVTFPEEAEQERLRSIPPGTLPPFPNSVDRARGDIRRQILSIANRDKAFAQVLAKLGAKNLGTYEEHQRYSNLASDAFDAGDK